MHFEVDRQSDPERIVAQLEADLERVLADVRAAVEDWRPMRAKVEVAIADLQPAAPRCSSRPSWPRPRRSCAGSPTTISPCSATAATPSSRDPAGDQLKRLEGAALGILRRPATGSATLAQLRGPAAGDRARQRRDAALPLVITKANTRSTVHRADLSRLSSASSGSTPTARSWASTASSACSPRPPTTSARARSRCCAARSRG